MSVFYTWDENNQNILKNEQFDSLSKTGFETNKPILSAELNTILKQNSVIAHGFLKYIAECNNVDLDMYLQNNSIETFLSEYLSASTVKFIQNDNEMITKNQIYYNTSTSLFWFVDNQGEKNQLFSKASLKLKSKIYYQDDKKTAKNYLQEILYDRAENTPISCLLFSPGGDAVLRKVLGGSNNVIDINAGGSGGNLKFELFESSEANKIQSFNISFLQDQSVCTCLFNDTNSKTLVSPVPERSDVNGEELVSGGSGGGGGGAAEPWINLSNFNLNSYFFIGGSGTYGGGGGGGGQLCIGGTNDFVNVNIIGRGGVSTGYKINEDILFFGGSGGASACYPATISKEKDDNFIDTKKQNDYGGNGSRYIWTEAGDLKYYAPQNQRIIPTEEKIHSFKEQYNIYVPIGITSLGYAGNTIKDIEYSSGYHNTVSGGGGGGCGGNGGNGGTGYYRPNDSYWNRESYSGGGGGGGGFGENAKGGQGANGGTSSSGGGGGGGGFGAPGGDGYKTYGGGGGGYGTSGQGGSYNQKPGLVAGGSYAYVNPETGAADPTGGPGLCIIYYYTY